MVRRQSASLVSLLASGVVLLSHSFAFVVTLPSKERRSNNTRRKGELATSSSLSSSDSNRPMDWVETSRLGRDLGVMNSNTKGGGRSSSSSSSSSSSMSTVAPNATATKATSTASATTNAATTATQVVFGIRHGQSVSNVWMRGEQAWGAPTYNDTLNTPDAPLSDRGIAQASALSESLLRTMTHPISNNNDNSNADDRFLRESTALETTPITTTTSTDVLPTFAMDQIELIVVSPLTRCLQTYQYAIQPLLRQRQRLYNETNDVNNNNSNFNNNNTAVVPVLVQPLLAERLYSVSETGRPLSLLQRDFVDCHELDWSLLEAMPRGKSEEEGSDHHHDDDDKSSQCWWYTPMIPTSLHPENGRQSPKNDDDTEWRPHGQGQYYGSTVGEPIDVFQARMQTLQRWLQQRPERCILTIAHWGVYQHLAHVELDNCQLCSFVLPPPVRPSLPNTGHTKDQDVDTNNVGMRRPRQSSL